MTASVTRKCSHAMPMTCIGKELLGVVGMVCCAKDYCVASMPIRELNLKAPFRVEGGYMWPEFDKPHPVTSVVWKTPSSMRLVLAINIAPGYETMEHFLVAFNAKGQSWRMPLSNLYADCRLCHGRYTSTSATVLQACQLAWNQFQASAWNQDLYTDATPARREGSKSMFTYKVDNDKITQVEINGDWTKHCEKVATDFITRFVLL